MKLKSKLIIASAALITISGAAAGTSTFAWFTANRSAYTTVNATVKTGTDTLEVALAAATTTFVTPKIAGDTNIASASATTDLVSFAAGAIGTDVSGNGLTFYKPGINSGTDTAVTDSTEVTSSPLVENTPTANVAGTYVYYQQYRLTFSHTNSAITTGIFLSSASTLSNTVTTAPDPDIAKAYRVAILNENATTLIAYYAPNEEVAALCKYVYVSPANTSTIGAISRDISATNLGLSSNSILGKTFADVVDNTTGKSTGNGYLGQITGIDSLTLTIRIWCEGNDAACINDTLTQTVKSELVFNGVNMNS